MNLTRKILTTLLMLGSCSLSSQAIEVGQTAPFYNIRLADGKIFSESEGIGKVVVLHFWATWCEPCRAELPAIEKYYRKHHRNGLEFIAISMDDPADSARVREVLARYSYPGALISEADIRGYGRIWRIPLTFVIDRNGVLRYDAWGGGENGLNESVLESALTPLLAAKQK